MAKLDSFEDAAPRHASREGTRTATQVLADLLRVSSSTPAEAQAGLLSIREKLPPRHRELVDYVLTAESTESQLERRGGGISLRYILWWLQTHARRNAPTALTAALQTALNGNWPFSAAYEPLSFVPQVRRHLPRFTRETRAFDGIPGMSFLILDGICVVVDTEEEDRCTQAMQCGAQVYLLVSSTGLHLRIDGRSGMKLPETLLSEGWEVKAATSLGRPVYLFRKAPLSDVEMESLFDRIVAGVDRRWKDSAIPAFIGAAPITRTK